MLLATRLSNFWQKLVVHLCVCYAVCKGGCMREIVGNDSWLFGWDATPGIVSVWADRRGQAVLWQRIAGTLRCVRERYRPWVYATSLADLEHLGTNLRPDEHPHAQRGI